MIVKALNIKNFDIKKMSRNSLIVENKDNGAQMYIHRRVFNRAMEEPETPLFEVTREFMGCQTKWLAAPMTFLVSIKNSSGSAKGFPLPEE